MKKRELKQEHWREHIHLGQRYPEGIAAYCRHKSLPLPSFHYWKRKFKKSESIPAIVSPAFAPVTVSRIDGRLSDPEWLARFAGEFLRSVL